MKHLKHLLIASTVTALCACNNTKESPVSLQWEMVKNGAAPGFYESSFTITNTSTKPLESDWEIYYTQLSPRQVKVNEDSPVIIEMINAGYYKIAPSESWTPLAPGDSIKISYLNQGIFTQTLFTPKSPFFVTNNGTQISIPLSIAPFDRKEQWTVQGRIAPSYPDGEKVYADNQALETTYKIQTYDMLPSLKEVTPREGTSIISKDISLSVEDGFADEAKLLIQNLKEMGYNYLVEAADDICYQIMDIEDAHKLKILTTETVKKLFLDFFDDDRKKHINEVLEIVSDLNEQIVYLRSCVIGTLIDECSTLFCREEQALLEGRFKGALVDHISERPRTAYQNCADTAWTKIYKSSDVLDIELAGNRIISVLLDKFLDAVRFPDKAYSRLLLNKVPEQYEVHSTTLYGKVQAVIDYISGMTDVYALDLYRKINGMSLPSL